ncbi:MAG: macro domain-containing protein [Anaerolineaceae bacterium]|nr:macro domain-containing protein [Anaerolineaceae bacterium]
MPFQIIRNDITKVSADVIVNTANPKPIIGGGTDSAIYKAAGEALLLAEREKIGDIARGDAVSTPAFGLNAKYIIHTVGPVWIDGSHGERETLRSCYTKSLELADKLSCESIAFPLIATGVYGFPKDEALDIALAEIGKFLLTHEMEITLVVFDRKAMKLSEKLIGEIDKYIDEHTVGRLHRKEYEGGFFSNRRQRERDEDLSCSEISTFSETLAAPAFEETYERPMAAEKKAPSALHLPDMIGKKLDDLFKVKEDTFQQRLLKLIDERGLKDSDVYKKANIDRKVFSKIRSNEAYKPKKTTAVAFAIALQLDMDSMKDLLSRAGLAITPWEKFDLIISYFVTNKKYDIFEINAALFEYDQPLLGTFPLDMKAHTGSSAGDSKPASRAG